MEDFDLGFGDFDRDIDVVDDLFDREDFQEGEGDEDLEELYHDSILERQELEELDTNVFDCYDNDCDLYNEC